MVSCSHIGIVQTVEACAIGLFVDVEFELDEPHNPVCGFDWNLLYTILTGWGMQHCVNQANTVMWCSTPSRFESTVQTVEHGRTTS
jgi:hypothetical protein